MSCSSCISAMQVVKRMSFVSDAMLISSLVNVCKRSKKLDPEVCQGVIEEQAPVVRKVLKTMDVSGRDGHLLCAAVLNSCPYPAVIPWTVQFPKSKPKNPIVKRSKGQLISVVQLSDWHIDPDYQVGTEVRCSKPICCRAAYTDFQNITKPATFWGDYSCDTPVSLVSSMLKYIPTVEPKLAFGLITGDLPPHEVWSTLPITKTQWVEDQSFGLLHTHFDAPLLNTMLYPAVGNHESAPTNVFPLRDSKIAIEDDKEYLTMNWLYSSLAKSWEGWLPEEALVDVEKNSASYVARPIDGLKLISLNTNFCYSLNWWLYENPISQASSHLFILFYQQKMDPNGILSWLIAQLQESENTGERVWIMGHIAPGDTTCLHDYSNYYHQIVERYSHVIAGQFFGHTHKDEFQVFYRDGDKNAQSAISMAYIAPSITPYLNVNPGFRVYKVDTDTFEVVDSITYYAKLDEAEMWGEQGPIWQKEYSAREAYLTPNTIISPKAPLSPAWWHNVTEAMEDDPDMFQKYWHFRGKSSPINRKCDDEEDCRETIICNIRAGKSEQRCDYEPDIPEGVPPEYSRKIRNKERHLCGLELLDIRHDQ
ncbi:Metallo-dependent phosphatase-like protein [Phycomyces blakesleeanus]